MRNNKIILFFFIFFIGLYHQTAIGQALNINGDTIFVNQEAEVQIIFPTRPVSYNTIPARTQFHIWNVKTGINMIPVNDDNTPATLLVSEAGRNHRFILVYKRDISVEDAKLYYDYSTVDKLARHTSSKVFEKPATTGNNLINNTPVKYDAKNNKNNSGVEVPADSSLIYYALLEQGDKELKAQSYEAATANFTKAHTLRPEDPFPLQRLGDIKIKLAQQAKSAQAEVDKKYNSLIAEGKNGFDKKQYEEASEKYKQALELKPGDVYATRQLQAISKLSVNTQKPVTNKEEAINTTTDETVKQKHSSDEDNYEIAIKSADNYFKAGNYDSAKALYSASLIFSKKEWPESQIKRINKMLDYQVQASGHNKAPQPLKIIQQKKPATDSVLPVLEKPAQQFKMAPQATPATDSVLPVAEIKKSYNVALANAKSSYLKNDFLNAKIYYEEAITLQPLQQEPKRQLKIINGKLEEIARQNEIDSNYERTINIADSQVNAKAFEPAIITYKQALVIKPLEVYPKKQLKYLQSELVLNEKTKREEQQRQYAEALARADKAVADKNYDEAKSAYSQVLAIHPENDYAKKRLDIVSYQIEKAKVEKLRDDSLKQVVVPVKKLKRKKSI